MPYVIEKRKGQYCVKSTTSGKAHGCHDTRAEAIKQQRALYKNAPPSEEASSEAGGTMSAVEKRVPIKDVALLRLAIRRSEQESEQEVEKAITVASGLSDPEVAAQTVAVIGHLADRLRTAELNQAALVDALQEMSADSSASRSALLEALSGITERLAEAPQVNVTVPVPEVNVNVQQAGATTGTRTISLERDSAGKLVGAVVEEEGADRKEEAA